MKILSRHLTAQSQTTNLPQINDVSILVSNMNTTTTTQTLYTNTINSIIYTCVHHIHRYNRSGPTTFRIRSPLDPNIVARGVCQAIPELYPATIDTNDADRTQILILGRNESAVLREYNRRMDEQEERRRQERLQQQNANQQDANTFSLTSGQRCMQCGRPIA